MDTIVIAISKAINFDALDATIRATFPAAANGWDEANRALYTYNLELSDKPALQAIVDAHDAALIPATPAEIAQAERTQASASLWTEFASSPDARRVLEGNTPVEWPAEAKLLAKLVRALWLRGDIAEQVTFPEWRSESQYQE